MIDWIRYILARLGIMKYRVRITVHNVEPDGSGTYQADGCIETNYPYPFSVHSEKDGVAFRCSEGMVKFGECNKWYPLVKEGE